MAALCELAAGRYELDETCPAVAAESCGKVKAIVELRRQIQYAVDGLWPASRKGNAGTRVEFKLRPDRAAQ